MTRNVTSEHRRAFTLAEMLIVLALIGLVAGVAIPAAVNLSSSQSLAAARFIAADMRYVRSRAIATGRPLTVRFDPVGQRYSVSDEDGPIACPWGASNRFGGEFVVVLNEGTPFRSVRLATVDFGGNTWIRFGPLGEPEESGSLVVRHGREATSVTVAPGTGLIRVTQ